MSQKYIPRDQWSREHLSFWKVGKKWHCAVPRDDIATRNGFDWKNFGLIGRGSTKDLAVEDWETWIRCANFAADVY